MKSDVPLFEIGELGSGRLEVDLDKNISYKLDRTVPDVRAYHPFLLEALDESGGKEGKMALIETTMSREADKAFRGVVIPDSKGELTFKGKGVLVLEKGGGFEDKVIGELKGSGHKETIIQNVYNAIKSRGFVYGIRNLVANHWLDKGKFTDEMIYCLGLERFVKDCRDHFFVEEERRFGKRLDDAFSTEKLKGMFLYTADGTYVGEIIDSDKHRVTLSSGMVINRNGFPLYRASDIKM